MKLFLISREEYDYDEFDAFVVAAVDETHAKRVVSIRCLTWPVDLKNVTVRVIGKAALGTKPGIILGSFNAG